MSDPEHPESGSDALPPGVGPAVTEPEYPILLLVGADASEGVVGEAIRMADARASLGLTTTLMDAGVTEPRLHRALGVDNLEGLADVFLFGASLPKVATRPDGHRFDFIPAGAYAPDPAGVLDSARWDRIAAEARAAGSQVLVFVPAATPGLGALSRRAGRAILIGDDAEMGRITGRLDRTCEVLATVRPSPPATTVADDGPESKVAPLAEDRALTEPPVFRRDQPARPRWGLVAGITALAIALGVGGWFLYQQYLAPGVGAAATADPDQRVEAPARRGAAMETPIPVSVAVEAHPDLPQAQERVAALRRAEPAVDFFLAPVAVNGSLYYRLLAGPVADRDAGTALLQRLVDAGHKTAFDTWAVRPTTYAFHLGEYDTREEADARVAALARLEIPAYIVRIRHDPGAPRHRVYGGAYETAVEAEVMTELLETADQEARLVPRTGEPRA